MINNLLALIFAAILHSVRGQSDPKTNSDGQINRLVFDSVSTSPAFITRSQFVEAWNAAIPYLQKPENVTHLEIFQYPHFVNTAINIGKINSKTQMAMYFAQVLYQTNGLTIKNVMPCSRFGSQCQCSDYISANVNNTGGYCDCVDYHGRGNLFIENVSDYQAASKALFNNDVLYQNPDHVAKYPQIAWATAAWNWVTNVGSIIGSSDSFGLTTKFLRPNDCSSSTQPSDAATQAFNIYQQVLSVFDPEKVASSAGCGPSRS